MNRNKRKHQKKGIKLIGMIIVVLVTSYVSFLVTKNIIQQGETTKAMIQITKKTGIEYELVKKEKSDMYEGPLILVNHQYPYHFKKSNIQSIASIKNKYYQVRDNTVSLNTTMIEVLNQLFYQCYLDTNIKNIMAYDGFRTYQTQQKILDSRLKTQGEEAKKWVSLPGSSEHHTGLALDLSIYKDGESVDFKNEGNYQWLEQHVYSYGLVIRYDISKSDITKINYEPWHLRYVGIPHAYLMQKNKFCLEEYIEYLKQFSFEKKHLITKTENGEEYEIYYVKADDLVHIPVPKELSYDISGNNVDGFIITIKKDKNKESEVLLNTSDS